MSSARSSKSRSEPGNLRLPSATDSSAEAAAERREVLSRAGHNTDQLAGQGPSIPPEELGGSIEGFIGFAQVPVGVFGPLRLNGDHAKGDFIVPVATTEGSLVASYQHVANLLGRCGGIELCITAQGVGRSPCFAFDTLADARRFAEWLPTREADFAEVVAGGSRYCRLKGIGTSVIGTTVFVRLDFATGDAAGQNMVTLATQSVCTRVLDEAPIAPTAWLLEANHSGDKKATHMALAGVRGRRVTARAQIPDRLVQRYFRTPAAWIASGFEHTLSGSLASGAVGSQTNVANALAGLFIACGQDVACVAEAAAGITRARLLECGDLEVTVTLPNLIVGTVGGGTRLPGPRECLSMLGCTGEGTAVKLAEIFAGVALCGEIGLFGAMAGGSFAAAHAALGRRSGE